MSRPDVFEGRIGLIFIETTADRVCVAVVIGPELRQAAGVVHGCVLLDRRAGRAVFRSGNGRAGWMLSD
ncbi:MAG: hypothetical protein ABSD32_23830 [Mycobacterium sp.]